MFKSKATIVSIVFGSLLGLGIGGMRSNSSKPHSQPVAESSPIPIVAQSLDLKAKVSKPAPTDTASPIPAAPKAIPVEKVEQSKLQQEANYGLGDTVRSGNWDFTALSTRITSEKLPKKAIPKLKQQASGQLYTATLRTSAIKPMLTGLVTSR